MTEIRLNFTDDEGYPKRISVAGDSFYIGRTPENDLCISDKRLSRQHLLIERFGNKISVSDCNSSNGTTLNNYDLFETETLRDGDVLSLGGVEIRVEIVSESEQEVSAPQQSAPKIEESRPAATVQQSVPQTVGGISTNFFFIAPLIGLVVLLFVGGLIFAIGGGSGDDTNTDIADSKTPTDTEKTPRKTPDADKTPSFSPSPTSSGDISSNSPTPSPTAGSGDTTQTPVVVSSETENVKKIAPEFMRRIARNDPNPFLENPQAEDVLQKIKSLKNSSALVDGLRSVARDKSQFETLANSKGLKPQFLAAAALNVGGNPTETAQTILPILGNLRISLSTDFADDCLIIMAAYNQGKSGDFKSLQQKIEGLSKKLSNEGKSVSSRKLRSIWFLKDKGRITPAEFDNALNFLAIGVIMQNPKAFGVNAEAVVF